MARVMHMAVSSKSNRRDLLPSVWGSKDKGRMKPASAKGLRCFHRALHITIVLGVMRKFPWLWNAENVDA